MRTDAEWLCEMQSIVDLHGSLIPMGLIIRAIQSDAARSERERAARVCDQTEAFTDIDGERQMRHLNYHEIRERIRALPDVADGKGKT